MKLDLRDERRYPRPNTGKRMRRLLLATLVAAGCDRGEPVSLSLDHYQVPCLLERLQLCMLAKEGDEKTFDQFFETIEGYTHAWGNRVELNALRRTRFTSTGAESSGYELDEVLSQSPVEPGVTFTYPFRPNEQDPDAPMLTRNAGTLTGTFADGRAIVCETEEICQQLDDSLGSSSSLIIDVRYPDPITDPLILYSLTLSL